MIKTLTSDFPPAVKLLVKSSSENRTPPGTWFDYLYKLSHATLIAMQTFPCSCDGVQITQTILLLPAILQLSTPSIAEFIAPSLVSLPVTGCL